MILFNIIGSEDSSEFALANLHHKSAK